MGCLLIGPWKNSHRRTWNQTQLALKARLSIYLENEVCFRDYVIKRRIDFGKINKVAVHQIVCADSIGFDVHNALETFSRDNFSSVVFYV